MPTDPVKDEYLQILEDASFIVTGRAESYDGFTIDDYMPHGDESYHQMCFLKVQRALSECRNGRSPEDSLLDLINYAAFWLGKHRAAAKQPTSADKTYDNSN